MKSTETKVKETLLQESIKVQIGEREYNMPPTTIATLVMVSEAISKIPTIKLENENNILGESIFMAKYANNIADAIAILVLGAKGCEVEKVITDKKFFGLIPIKETIIEFKKEELSSYITENLNFKEINELIVKVLSNMDIAFFFGIITSLNEINLIRRTRETETIVSGQ